MCRLFTLPITLSTNVLSDKVQQVALAQVKSPAIRSTQSTSSPPQRVHSKVRSQTPQYDMAKLKSKSDLLVLSIKSIYTTYISHIALGLTHQLKNVISPIHDVLYCLCSRLVFVCLFINGEWAKSKLWIIVTETYLRARQTTCRSAGGSYHNQLLLLVEGKVKWMC